MVLYRSLSRLSRPVLHQQRSLSSQTARNAVRPLSSTASTHATTKNPNPQRDAMKDREKMNTDANEYAKSGTDDTVAQNEDAAFGPNITDPQEAKKEAGKGNKVNPLDASPANPELSQHTSEVSGGGAKKISEDGGGRKGGGDGEKGSSSI